MESTGVYWIPAYEVLEPRGLEGVLVDARDAKHVPGRKTDVSDAQWLRRLHEHGLLRASFRPEGELAALRAYLRLRERLLGHAASHIQHMQKALMQMSVQPHHVVTDVTGATGMRILRAIVEGERDPAVLASHRDRRCHASVEEVSAALTGNWREEHIVALGQALELDDACQARSWNVTRGLRRCWGGCVAPLPDRPVDCPRPVIAMARQTRRASMLGRPCMRYSAWT
jgi:transposase